MTRTVDELVDLIASDPHLPLGDDAVRQQREDFHAGLWRRYLPAGEADRFAVESWPASATRQDLLDQAARVETSEDAVAAYLRVAGWGAGHQARPVWRCSRPFTDPLLGQRLIAARDQLIADGPVAAYWWMLPRGAHHVPHLGPAFFSKWLYFCDYPTIPDTPPVAGRPWALILDQRVQRALRLPGLGSHRHYATYLDLAHQAAAQLNTTPHAIEHALFTLGGVPLSAQQGRP